MTAPRPYPPPGAPAPDAPAGATGRVRRVVRLVREALGARAVPTACPHGSAVLGGPRPTSDVDALVGLARAPATPRTGRIRSRGEAAAVLLPEPAEEHRPVLAAARAQHPAGECGSWADALPAARAHAAHVAGVIKGARPA
ncbi:aminoglycoside adenylyltransferase domain-containing protein [Streptomyces sp. NPDC014656]|uniref:aminoglycoside adenylyltransferase domain-containing protein n=1 Tax=Streptomyces sp. NPDC014656 TaxID=3364878 RepID=UPI0036FEAF81